MGKPVWWLGQGALIPLLYLLFLLRTQHVSQSWFDELDHFFMGFWQWHGLPDFLRRLLWAPLFQFGVHAGMISVLAPLGFGAHCRRHPELALMTALSSLMFLPVYCLWVTDLGAFYTPLLPVWGLFAALGLETIAARVREPFPLGIAAVILGVLFIWAPWDLRPAPSAAHQLPMSLVFLAFCLGTGLIGARLRTPRTRRSAAATWPTHLLCAIILVGTNGLAHLPRVLRLQSPDTVTEMARVFEAHTPRGARLLHSRVPERVVAQTERETLSLQLIDTPTAQVFELWIQESRACPGRSVYLDAQSPELLRDLLNSMLDGHVLAGQLDLVPVVWDGFIFYRLEITD